MKDEMMRGVRFICFATLLFLPSLDAQIAGPAALVKLPKAVYAPRPVYRPEWAKQGLKGKGIVLVTIDPKTGGVTGVRMLESTGNQLLDGAALQAYSQWRFEPGSVPQVKIPIEFRPGPSPGASGQKGARPGISYLLIILIAAAGVVMAIRRRKPTDPFS